MRNIHNFNDFINESSSAQPELPESLPPYLKDSILELKKKLNITWEVKKLMGYGEQDYLVINEILPDNKKYQITVFNLDDSTSSDVDASTSDREIKNYAAEGNNKYNHDIIKFFTRIRDFLRKTHHSNN